jgi:hypothetical protein
LKPISAIRQNQPETIPTQNHRQRKTQELENLLAKKIILTLIADLKNATAKSDYEFLSQS